MDTLSDFLDDMVEGKLGASSAEFELWKLKNPDGDWQIYVNELAEIFKTKAEDRLRRIYW